MRKFKFYIIGVVIILLIIVTIFCFKIKNADIKWVKDLSYEENQVYDISFNLFSPCPTIPVKIGDKKVKLLFDSGNGVGITLTTAIEKEIDYEIIGTTTELNSDGTYRGDGKSILLKNIYVFDEEYTNIKSSLVDWKMYSSFKINGTIGLKYFDNKIVTLDYKNKKIAVSDKALDYSKLNNDKYTVIPLIKSNLDKEQDLLFIEGEVNGEKSTIFLDTGSSRSFYNFDDTQAEIKVQLGEKTYTFSSNEFIHDEIGFQDEFKYPLTLAINSDLLKANHFVITIDKIQNNLIIGQNSYMAFQEQEFTFGSPHYLYIYFRDAGSFKELSRILSENVGYAEFSNGCRTGCDSLALAEYALETGDFEHIADTWGQLNGFNPIPSTHQAGTQLSLSFHCAQSESTVPAGFLRPYRPYLHQQYTESVPAYLYPYNWDLAASPVRQLTASHWYIPLCSGLFPLNQ